MTMQVDEPDTVAQAEALPAPPFDEWELDITIVESGPEADRLIRMTDDNCGATCESACSPSCS